MASNDKALPPGWEYRWDPAQKAYFYVNHSTRKTQWEDPRIAYYQELSKTEDGNDGMLGIYMYCGIVVRRAELSRSAGLDWQILSTIAVSRMTG